MHKFGLKNVITRIKLRKILFWERHCIVFSLTVVKHSSPYLKKPPVAPGSHIRVSITGNREPFHKSQHTRVQLPALTLCYTVALLFLIRFQDITLDPNSVVRQDCDVRQDGYKGLHFQRAHFWQLMLFQMKIRLLAPFLSVAHLWMNLITCVYTYVCIQT